DTPPFLYIMCHAAHTATRSRLSLHAALPICLVRVERRSCRLSPRVEDRSEELPRLLDPVARRVERRVAVDGVEQEPLVRLGRLADRKSTRLNSSHDQISYAVFCLKKKKKTNS